MKGRKRRQQLEGQKRLRRVVWATIVILTFLLTIKILEKMTQ